MKEKLKFLISSAIITLTFLVPQVVHGMEGCLKHEENENPSGIQQLSNEIDTKLQHIKNLQNNNLTYGELSNVLESIDKFYSETSSDKVSSEVINVISDMNKDINMQFIGTPQAREILVNTQGHNTRGVITHVEEECRG